MILRLTPLILVLALLGCSAEAPVRYDLPRLPAGPKIPIGVSSVEVREVSLPLYANLEEIAVESASGEVVTDPDLLWADDPTRSVTEALAIDLAALTNARVAAEPWPFSENPQVRVDVRFNQALAGRDGQFRIAGQYFVASVDGRRRDVARRFSLAAPWDPTRLSTVAPAKSRVVQDLARMIARDGL